MSIHDLDINHVCAAVLLFVALVCFSSMTYDLVDAIEDLGQQQECEHVTPR